MQNALAAQRKVVPFVSSVTAVHARLAAWDLSVVKKHAVQVGLYPADEIDAVEAEYKKWLALAIVYRNEPIPISAAIDSMWHHHIIFTQDYTAMGVAMTGKYLHHRPSILDDKKDLERAFDAKTLIRYKQHFGTPDPKYWDSVLCKCGPTD